MSARTILGAALLSLPFIALFVFCVVEIGWRATLGIFAATAATFVVIAVGVELINGGA